MSRSPRTSLIRHPWLLLGWLIFASCAASPQNTETAALSPQAPVAAAPEASSDQAITSEAAKTTGTAANPDSSQAATPPRSRPQLIKSAAMTLRVEQIEPTLKKVMQILRTQQGDLLGLQDQTPAEAAIQHTVSLQLRVPQERLETTLEELTPLGTVLARSLNAEDVSEQRVDLQARLRNLRKAEELVLKIMERSGSIKEVLEVSRELSTIRATIEQLDAQLNSLENRVAYSQIALSLETAIATTPPALAFGQQMQQTWGQATHSVGAFTTELLQLGLWLLVYSPYLAILAIAITLGWRRLRRKPQTATLPPESQASG